MRRCVTMCAAAAKKRASRFAKPSLSLRSHLARFREIAGEVASLALPFAEARNPFTCSAISLDNGTPSQNPSTVPVRRFPALLEREVESFYESAFYLCL